MYTLRSLSFTPTGNNLGVTSIKLIRSIIFVITESLGAMRAVKSEMGLAFSPNSIISEIPISANPRREDLDNACRLSIDESADFARCW